MDPTFRQLVAAIRDELGALSALGLANAAWAGAVLGLERWHAWAAAMEAALVARPVGEFKEQELTSALWALAKSEMGSCAAFAPLLQEAWLRLGRMRPNQLAMLVLAVAEARVHIPELMIDAFEALEAGDGVAQLYSNSAVSVLYALARLSYAPPEVDGLVAGIVERLLRPEGEQRRPALESLSPREVGVCVWAMGSIARQRLASGRGVEGPVRSLVAALLARVENLPGTLTPMQLANVAHGAGMAQMSTEGMLARVERDALRLSADGALQPGDMAHVAWALATLQGSRASPRFLAALEARLAEGGFLAQSNAYETTLCAWALVVAGRRRVDVFARVRAHVAELRGFTPEALRMLHSLELGLLAPMPAGDDIGVDASDRSGAEVLSLLESQGQLRVRAYKEWHRARRQRPQSVSALQRSVHATATALFVPQGVTAGEVVLEHEAEEYSVDVAVPSRRVAIEVDGPSHWVRDASSGAIIGPSGATVLKHRLLEEAGWRVASVGYHHWQAARSGAARCELLASLLGDALTAPQPTHREQANIIGPEEVAPGSEDEAAARQKMTAARLLKQSPLKRAVARRRR